MGRIKNINHSKTMKKEKIRKTNKNVNNRLLQNNSVRNEGIFNLKLLGRIVLCTSFLPYIAGVILGIVYAISGYDVTTYTGVYVKTIYGFEAFRDVITWYGLGLIFIPIIPVCLIFQIVYFICWLVKYIKKSKKGTKF